LYDSPIEYHLAAETQKTSSAGSGQIMGAALRRNGKIRIVIAFFSLFVFTILLSYGAYFLGGLRKIQSRVAREHPTMVQNAPPPPRNDSAGRGSPDKHSQLIGMATKAADETDAAAETLFREVEPPSLLKDNDLGAANRENLEALRSALETAATAAATVTPRYLALLKSEHDKVEIYARSLNAEKDFITTLLRTIDKRHAEVAGSTSQVLMARADFYRTYETYAALLVGEFGRYKVVDGQLIFPIQRTVDRYNIAAHAMAVAAKRLAEREGERKRLIQLQQEQWHRIVQND
jgi:hypothetical protein